MGGDVEAVVLGGEYVGGAGGVSKGARDVTATLLHATNALRTDGLERGYVWISWLIARHRE